MTDMTNTLRTLEQAESQLREICERYMFVFQGRVSEAPDFPTLVADERVRGYLGHLIGS